jgi:hypothetical protein
LASKRGIAGIAAEGLIIDPAVPAKAAGGWLIATSKLRHGYLVLPQDQLNVEIVFGTDVQANQLCQRNVLGSGRSKRLKLLVAQWPQADAKAVFDAPHSLSDNGVQSQLIIVRQLIREA